MEKFNLVTSERYITDPIGLCHYLYSCYINNVDCIIEANLDAFDCNVIGLYNIVDEFVINTGYDASRITIINGNMLQDQYGYNVVSNSDYWYEINTINQWLDKNTPTIEWKPTKHFGCFIGRSTWSRIWISAYLFQTAREKSLQTFHSGLHCNYVIPESDDTVDRIGLDDLDNFDCNYWTEIVAFLNHTPLKIDQQELDSIWSESSYIPANNGKCYPIQHPGNLNILQYYNNFFVDIVCESCTLGEVFFLTEKTFRPIVAQRPFILLSNRESLYNLRKLGFKTFEHWWDESYDDYGERERVERILTLIDNISQWSLDKLHSTLLEMQPILKHNYQVFRNLTTNKVKEIFHE